MMDLNNFGAELIKHLARIANAAEGIEAKVSGTAGKAGASTTTSEVKTEKVAKPTAEKPKAEAKKPTKSRDEMVAALMKVKDDCGKEVASEIIKEVGGVAKMADIPDAKIDAVFAAAEDKHAEMVKDPEEAGDL